jgi:hypothetical protein
VTPSTAGCCTKGMRGATSGAKGINDLMPAIWRKYKTPDFAWVTDEQVLSTLRELTARIGRRSTKRYWPNGCPKPPVCPWTYGTPGFPTCRRRTHTTSTLPQRGHRASSGAMRTAPSGPTTPSLALQRHVSEAHILLTCGDFRQPEGFPGFPTALLRISTTSYWASLSLMGS